MNPDVETYSYFIRKRIDSIRECLPPLNEDQINRAPPVKGANSAFVIATHVLGNARAWVLGIACGRELKRDRPAEFAARGTLADFDKAASVLSSQIESALCELDPAQLDRRFKPSQELWGEGEPREVTARRALADVLEHAALHLGQVQPTRDWVLSEAAV